MARALRRLGFAGGIGSLLWVADDKFNDGTFIRNFRTVYVAGRAAIEYKMMHADNMDGMENVMNFVRILQQELHVFKEAHHFSL